MDANFNEPGVTPLNKGLLTFAAYNAGPAAYARYARETESAASIRMSGSATSNRSPRNASAARP
jgi:hypothetical protein